jgi:hypothetical protein
VAEPERDLVLTCTHRMPEAGLREVRTACSRAELEVVLWSGEGPLPALRQSPLLLIGALPPLERRIPENLAVPMTTVFPGLPLLLLCEEALVRPSMALQGGRVSLLGPTLSSARIHNRIAALIADRRIEPRRRGTLPMGIVPVRPPVLTTEDERPLWWTATVECHGPSLRADSPGPAVRHHITTGLTAVIPFPEALGGRQSLLDVGEVEHVFAATGDVDSDLDRERILREAVGESAGVVHLGPAADEWFFYWPRPEAPLSIFSRTRLPNLWDLRQSLAATGSRVLRLAAESGDLVVALSAPLPVPADIPAAAYLAQILINGGSPAFRLLEGRLREHPLPLACALTEIL